MLRASWARDGSGGVPMGRFDMSGRSRTGTPVGTWRARAGRLAPAPLAALAITLTACGSSTASLARGAAPAMPGAATATAPSPAPAPARGNSTQLPPPTPSAGAGAGAGATTVTATGTLPTAAESAAWAADGVGCAPVSAYPVAPRAPGAIVIRWTARLGGYVATVTDRIPGGGAEPAPISYREPVLTVDGPRGRFTLPLGEKHSVSLTGLTPTALGPGRESSPMCLVRFTGAARPAVLFGVGGPGSDLAALWAYVVAVPIGTTGLAEPVTDLPLTGGLAGLSGQQVVFDRGSALLLGQNGAFGYRGAATLQPPIVIAFLDGRFANVTRSHPELVASSAAGFWSGWRGPGDKPPADPFFLQPLQSWAAVECVTGHQSLAYARLATLQAAGWVTASFVGTTEAELVSTGYCTRTP